MRERGKEEEWARGALAMVETWWGQDQWEGKEQVLMTIQWWSWDPELGQRGQRAGLLRGPFQICSNGYHTGWEHSLKKAVVVEEDLQEILRE